MSHRISGAVVRDVNNLQIVQIKMAFKSILFQLFVQGVNRYLETTAGSKFI